MEISGKQLDEIVDAVTRCMTGDASSVTHSEKSISLSAAKRLSEAVENEAARIGVKAVVAIANAGANPVSVHCTDGSFIASYDVAFNKAYTVVALKMSTSTLKHLSQPGQSLYGIQFTNQSRIVVFGGGEPLISGGDVIGGLGVSGGSEEQDTYLAEYGARYFKEELL